MLRFPRSIAPALGAVAVLCTPQVVTSQIVYENDFSVDVLDFTENTDAMWTHDTVDEAYHFLRSGVGPSDFRSALVEMPGFDGSDERDFQMSVVLLINDPGQNEGHAGFIAFADAATNAAATAYYEAYVTRAPSGSGSDLVIREVGGDATPRSVHVNAGLGGTTLLELDGTFLPGGELELELSWSRTEMTLLFIDATVTNGSWNGLAAGKQLNNQAAFQMNVDFDDFAVIPEPSARPMLAAGVLAVSALGARRQRRGRTRRALA